MTTHLWLLVPGIPQLCKRDINPLCSPGGLDLLQRVPRDDVECGGRPEEEPLLYLQGLPLLRSHALHQGHQHPGQLPHPARRDRGAVWDWWKPHPARRDRGAVWDWWKCIVVVCIVVVKIFMALFGIHLLRMSSTMTLPGQ